MTESQVYWWLMLDNISGFFFFVGILYLLFLMGTIITLFILFTNEDDVDPKKAKKLIFILTLFLPLFISSLFVPNSKQYAMIKVFPKIVNSDIAKEIPEDMKGMYDMAKDYMKEILKVDKK